MNALRLTVQIVAYSLLVIAALVFCFPSGLRYSPTT